MNNGDIPAQTCKACPENGLEKSIFHTFLGYVNCYLEYPSI